MNPFLMNIVRKVLYTFVAIFGVAVLFWIAILLNIAYG